MRHPIPARLFVLVAGLLSGACTDIEGGNREPARQACVELCDLQAASEGCAGLAGPCRFRCDEDTHAFTERCLLAARERYLCALEVAWTCRGTPPVPETADGRCDAEEADFLACKITGEPRP